MRGCGHPPSDLDQPCPWCRIAELERAIADARNLTAIRCEDAADNARADEREQIARQILVVREMSPDLPEKKGWEDACDAMLNMLEDMLED